MGFFKNLKLAYSLLTQKAEESDVGQQFSETGLGSMINKLTGKHLTGAEREANQFSAEQAQIQRDYETEMSNTAYQRQVADMQAAGVNPALLYGSGASGASTPSGSAPSSVAPNSGTSMSELMQLFMMPAQKRLIEAQASNTDALTDKAKADTEQMKLVNKYYPQVTETQIDKMLAEIGVDEERVKEIRSNVNLNDLNAELLKVDKVIKDAEANEASAFFKARREFEEAQTDKAKAEKAELVVRTAMEELEKNYMARTNTKMGSATVIAIAAALGTLLSGFSFGEKPSTFEGWNSVAEKFKSWAKKYGSKLGDWIDKPKRLF